MVVIVYVERVCLAWGEFDSVTAHQGGHVHFRQICQLPKGWARLRKNLTFLPESTRGDITHRPHLVHHTVNKLRNSIICVYIIIHKLYY